MQIRCCHVKAHRMHQTLQPLRKGNESTAKGGRGRAAGHGDHDGAMAFPARGVEKRSARESMRVAEVRRTDFVGSL